MINGIRLQMEDPINFPQNIYFFQKKVSISMTKGYVETQELSL